MTIFLTETMKPRWVGRYRVDGERSYRTFDIGADNKESVLSTIQSNHPGKTISEFRAHKAI